MNPTPKVYDKKLAEEHMVYIHSRTITLTTFSGESLAKEIKQKFRVEVTGQSINNFLQEIGLKFRPPIRSVYISPPAVTKSFNSQNIILIIIAISKMLSSQMNLGSF